MSVRIAIDPRTFIPKGYGFCEYKDVDTAHKAVHTIDGMTTSGYHFEVCMASAAP